MTDTYWSFMPLLGLALAFLSNVLRALRTQDPGCLGHVLVSSEEMTVVELALNRIGIAVFAVGVVGALVT